MTFGFYFFENVRDFSLADDERRAGDAHIFFAVHALLDPDPVFFRHRVVFVGEQREVQVELLRKFRDVLDRVGAEPEDRDVELFIPRQRVSEPAGLLGATGGVGLGVEVKNDGLVRIRTEVDRLPVAGRKLELGRGFTDGGDSGFRCV